MSLDTILDLLRCPHCSGRLDRLDRSVRCPTGHTFDIARQGYVNLLGRDPQGRHADTAEMISARDRFLSHGHYRPLADRIATLAADTAATTIGEFGAGTGYYLAQVLDRVPAARGLATDVSPYAGRRAARAHDRLGAIVADTWAGLPIADRSLDLIMVIFAPRNPAEFARLLRPSGQVLVAAAGPDHLSSIRADLGLLEIEADKRQRLLHQFGDQFRPTHSETVATTLQLNAADLHDLVAMGPNAHHSGNQLAERIAALDPPVEVSCRFDLTLFSRTATTN